MKLFRLLYIFAALISASVAGAVSPQEAVDAFAKAPQVPAGSSAVIISDLKTGDIIASLNADKPLTPASIMKSVSIASLSEVTDQFSTWDTPVAIEGKVDNDGVLHGNIIIEAKGDPSINNASWPKSEDLVSEIVSALKARGINKITGKIIIDESYFKGPAIPESWAAGDLPHSYGTGSHAFNFRNNATGKRAERDPAGIFGAALRSALTAAGIGLGNESVKEGHRTDLLTHKSAELRDIMRSCMNRSDNLFAETFLRRFGKERGGDGSTADAATRESEYWKRRGAPMEGVVIVDGSGLSRSNRVTARFMEEVLRQKEKDVEYVSYFPLAGQEGTLRSFLAETPLDSYIALKTGSMSGIQCYAGYKLDDDFAPTHAVVVIVNNFAGSRSALRGAIEKMLLAAFENN